MNRTNIHKNIAQLFGGDYNYIVPLYQRNFAWREREITQLLQDLYENFKIGKPYFVGSIIYINRNDTDNTLLEVIDGQQRLTVLTIILNVLGKKLLPKLYARRLEYDSRSEVAEYLDLIYSDADPTEGNVKGNQQTEDSEVIKTFKEAYNTIKDCPLEADDRADKKEKANLCISKLKEENEAELRRFADYIANEVYFVLAEMPHDTDVATYFEIMNNTGDQLKKHEIVKSQVLAKGQEKGLSQKQMKSLAIVWDACSQMDSPVQSSIPAAKRALLFGANYDSFNPNAILDLVDSTAETDEEAIGLEAIIADNKYANNEKKRKETNEEVDDDDDDENRGAAIIDFPNFLMHVLRLCYNHWYKKEAVDNEEKNSIPLNEKDLLTIYRTIEDKIDPVDFISKLLYYRIILDRYLIRSEKDPNAPSNEDGRWILKKPAKDSKSTTVRQKETFSEDSKGQENAIKALSMLQVSYPQRKYKRYLNRILKWFEYGRVEYGYDWYMPQLNSLINEFMDGIEKAYENDPKKDLYSLGTSTPRFVLNLVDYLYYLRDGGSDFDFRYYNSVEHHLAQSSKMYRIEDADNIDQIGNLFLLSRRRNSSLNDGDPLTKAKKVKGADKKFSNLPPNRTLIYTRTYMNNGWGKDEISQHTDEIRELLTNRKALLKVKNDYLDEPQVDEPSIDIEEPIDTNDVDFYRACLSVRNYCPVYGQSQEGTRYNFRGLSTPLGVEAEKEVKGWLKANPDRNIQDFISEQLEHNEDLKAEPWRWLLVSDRSAMEYCQEGIFLLGRDKEVVYLLPRVRMGKSAQELREYVLGMKLREKGYEVYIDHEYGVYMALGTSTFLDRFPNADVTLRIHLIYDEECADWHYGSDWHYGVMSNRKAHANENKALVRSGWTKDEEGGYHKGDSDFICNFSEDYSEVIEGIRDILTTLDKVE